MRLEIGRTKAVSNRGLSKERTIKKKPKCSFRVRKRGTKPVPRTRATVVEIYVK